MASWRLPFLALLAAASLPASAGLFSDDQARAGVTRLTQETQKLREDLTVLEQRIGRLDTQLRAQGLIDLVQQVEALKTELARLRGQIEVNTHTLETLEKRQRDLYVDLDERLRKLEKSGETPAVTPAAAPPPTTAAASGADENRAYDAAFNLFKMGNYQAAVAAFENFLKSYPASPLAANAQYWIGNSYTALKDYKAAIAAQQKLLSQYPGSPKVPDALLNMASAQAELGDRNAARRTLEEIIARYPTSAAAELARKRLPSLR